jgi:hypothetical protein
VVLVEMEYIQLQSDLEDLVDRDMLMAIELEVTLVEILFFMELLQLVVVVEVVLEMVILHTLLLHR